MKWAVIRESYPNLLAASVLIGVAVLLGRDEKEQDHDIS